MENVSFSNRTKLAIDLAKKSGEAILQISRNGDMHIKEKGIKDVLTIADTTSEEIIIKGIKEYFDNDSIIAEEGGNCQTGSTEYTWVIDPLDGTLNFSRGIPFYCVSIGYMKNNKPAGGAIFIPTTNELFVCEQGKGSYCNGKRLQVSAVSELDKSLTTIGFNNRFPEMTTWFSEIHKNAMEQMQNVEKIFSTVISLCYVAAGKTEAHMELYCYLWDICVGSLLIEEAGGKVSAEKNTPLDFLKIEKQVILGTNRKIHNEFSDIIGTNSN
ncbi:MAG: inositol monophosphatase [Clostridia bacterium]|nr:inositol monophosphatase [Clostridia bacterium]